MSQYLKKIAGKVCLDVLELEVDDIWLECGLPKGHAGHHECSCGKCGVQWAGDEVRRIA